MENEVCEVARGEDQIRAEGRRLAGEFDV